MAGKIERFEDLLVWQRGRALVVKIYRVTNAGAFAKDFGLRDQIRRAAVSVPSNVAEGFEKDGTREFAQYVSNAKRSCGEVRSQLYQAFDIGYLTGTDFEELKEDCLTLSRMLAGLLKQLKRTPFAGIKYQSVLREGPDEESNAIALGTLLHDWQSRTETQQEGTLITPET